MKTMPGPSTATGAAAHFVLGITGAVVALWVAGPWLPGLAIVAAGYVGDSLGGLGSFIAGLGAIMAAIGAFLGGIVVLVGSPVCGAALLIRGVENTFRNVRHARRP